MYLLVNLQKRQSTKHLRGGGYCLDLHGAFRAWAGPGDLECLEGPLLVHYLPFLPTPVRGMLTQNLAGGRFSREGRKGVNGTMAQIVWKKTGRGPIWSFLWAGSL